MTVAPTSATNPESGESMTAASPGHPTPHDPTDHGGFRGDIQGLRAVAVLLVALGHAAVPHLEGGYIGVDVFFVLSGFLITGVLVRRARREQTVSFSEFYAARARRILPAASLTLVTTMIASWAMLNFVRAKAVFVDSVWAAFFAANIHFARIGTDYFARNRPPSPTQHFWSLAVEEQFYLVFPALVMVALFVTRRWSLYNFDRYGVRHRWSFARQPVDDPALRRLVATVSVIVVASFAWSVFATDRNPTAAYFSAFTRAWELGVGVLLALLSPTIARVPAAVRAAAAWIGLGAIIASAFVFDATTVFPGWIALVPVLGTAAALAGGIGAASPIGPGGLLALPPLRFVGDVSYSFYLWHWPVLVLVAQSRGQQLSVATNLVLLAVAFAIAVATYFVLERPLHRGALLRDRRRALTVWPVALSSVVVVAMVATAVVNSQHSTTVSDVAAELQFPPATTATPNTTGGTGSTTTFAAGEQLDSYAGVVAASVRPTRLAQPVPDGLQPGVEHLADGQYDPGSCSPGFGSGTTAQICHLGDTAAKRTVVVIGDSHARMWIKPLATFAAASQWDLVPMFKQGCVSRIYGGGNDRSSGPCLAWWEWAKGQLSSLRPDAVVFAESYGQAAVGKRVANQAINGIERQLRELAPLAKHLVMFEDIPVLGRDPVDCLLASGAKLGTCTYDASPTAEAMTGQFSDTTKRLRGDFVPVSQWFCSGARCPTVIGNVIAYRDIDHVSPFYADILATPLGERLRTVLR